MRLDDHEMNICSEVAAALGYVPPSPRRQAPGMAPAPAAAPRSDLDGPGIGDVIGWIITGVTGLLGGFAFLVVMVVLVGFVATVVNLANTPQRQQPVISQPAPVKASRAPVPSKQVESQLATAANLPPEYDIGRLTAQTMLVREMPRGGAVDPLADMPAGTCLLIERENANGWRRVVSFDGTYRGYAQVYPVSYQPRPMHPLFTKLIPLIRGIP